MDCGSAARRRNEPPSGLLAPVRSCFYDAFIRVGNRKQELREPTCCSLRSLRRPVPFSECGLLENQFAWAVYFPTQNHSISAMSPKGKKGEWLLGSFGLYIKFENAHCSPYLALTVPEAAECFGHAEQSWLCHCGKPRAKARSPWMFSVSKDDLRNSSASLVPWADSREQQAGEVAGPLHDHSLQLCPMRPEELLHLS